MNDLKSFVVINNDKQPNIKDLAYGGSKPLPASAVAGNLFKLRRGAPVMRAGKLVTVIPQFKTQTIYSVTSGNAQLPGITSTPVAIAYPTQAR